MIAVTVKDYCNWVNKMQANPVLPTKLGLVNVCFL